LPEFCGVIVFVNVEFASSFTGQLRYFEAPAYAGAERTRAAPDEERS
jgi:hypothetical protein